MSIVRIGLGENTKYGDGWDAIFGGKAKASRSSAKPKSAAKKKAKGKKKK